MYRMNNVVRHYAWGGASFIPELLGLARQDGRRYAELWIGAHPNGSSRLRMAEGERSLYELSRGQPRRWLGAEGDFPFLLKVLSVRRALSIQAHPDEAQACAGYAREEERGLRRDEAARIYKDRHHKPELMCALTPFWAMCGFRPQEELQREFGRPWYRALWEERGRLGGENAVRMRWLFPLLLRLNRRADARAALLRECAAGITAACPDVARAAGGGGATPPDGCSPQESAYWWVLRLMEQFPDDLGALAPLYLNVFALRPTEALYIGARTVHAYLYGDGVEIMANSDNVLRGGLSVKHIDVDELLRVVDVSRSEFARVNGRRAEPREATTPREVPGSREMPESHEAAIPREAPGSREPTTPRTTTITEYRTPASEFMLCAIDARAGALTISHAPLPKIFLCLEGHAQISTAGASITVRRGQALFCLPDEHTVAVQGAGRVYMALPATEARYDFACAS